jgi:predicted RNA-binding Zn-ribbon protein involved in translation (DUF1610 family)
MDKSEQTFENQKQGNSSLGFVSNRSKAKRVSSDGVFFSCDNCGFEPQVASSTDDLLIMHFCPKCGSEFECLLTYGNMVKR